MVVEVGHRVEESLETLKVVRVGSSWDNHSTPSTSEIGRSNIELTMFAKSTHVLVSLMPLITKIRPLKKNWKKCETYSNNLEN